jgi:tetratricopeptide (TPR) repeat protein
MVYAQMSKFEDALASCQKAIILKKDDPAALAALGVTYGLWGKKSEAEWILGNLNELAKKKYVQPYDLAGIYAALGDKDQTIRLLDKAAQEHSFMHYLRIDPVFDKVRSDPRYTALVQSIDSKQ